MNVGDKIASHEPFYFHLVYFTDSQRPKQLDSLLSHYERVIMHFNRNLPDRCQKTSLRAFISWIAGMALSIEVSDH